MREEIYISPIEHNPDHVFHLEMAGISYCDNTYRIERTNCPFVALEYIVRGKGTLVINGLTFQPEKGDAYILHKDSAHEYFADAQDPWIKIWFAARGPLIDHLIQLYNLQCFYHIQDCNLETLFQEILDTVRVQKQNYILLNQTVSILVHRVIIDIAAKVARHRTLDKSPEAFKLKQYLDNHVESDVSIQDLSHHIRRSPSQTIRIFKKEFGIPPYEYLVRRRIETAKLLLYHTGIPIKQIAYKLKFCDEHYFSNVFRARTGMSPSGFRKRR
jgi:AraC family transcriptional regulator of arabinose operon